MTDDREVAFYREVSDPEKAPQVVPPSFFRCYWLPGTG